MRKLHGNIFPAVLLILLPPSCGQMGDSDNTESAEGETTEATEELKPVELPEARTAESGATLSYGFKADDTSTAMTSFMELLLNDVHNFWAELMMEGGQGMPMVDYILSYKGEEEETGCTPTGSTGPEDAFYCAEEDLIVLANELAIKVWESEAEAAENPEAGAAAGDFAVAALMADLYAHSLQGEWGWLPGQADQERLVPVENTELNANCLSGVWAQSVYGSEVLEAGAVEHAMETLADTSQHDLPDEPAKSTPAERTDAFMAGFESGMANSCNQYLSADGS